MDNPLRVLQITICPDCNTTVNFNNKGLTKEEILQALDLLKKEVESGNIEFKIYRDKLR